MNLKSSRLACVALGASLCLAALPAAAQSRPRMEISADIGIFMPSSREMRDLFGNSVAKIGLSPASHVPTSDWRPTTSFYLITANKDGNRFLVAPLTFDIERSFGPNREIIKPYIRVGVGVAYYDYSLTRGLTQFSNRTFGTSAEAEIGLALSQFVRVSAKYTALSKKDDFDFSGLSLNLSYILGKI